jgi:hypothetical protein
MTTHRAVFLLAIAVVACSDLPGHDDPRSFQDGEPDGEPDGGPAVARGSCSTDFFAPCKERAASQCTGGCQLADVCHLKTQGTCAVVRTPDACDGNAGCRWSSGFCQTRESNICGALYESRTACAASTPSDNCAWGTACSGSSSCFAARSSATCTALFGCKWMPF